MKYEVELKFPVSELSAVELRILVLGAEIGPARREVDLYFSHPARDFAHSDEALRIRRKGKVNSLTYKGPKIDPHSKTRRELDLPLPPGEQAAKDWIELLKLLGFTEVGTVSKARRKAIINWQDTAVEVSLDQVESLGDFVELEVVVGFDQMDSAKTTVASLADSLGLSGSERRSYLELLLERG